MLQNSNGVANEVSAEYHLLRRWRVRKKSADKKEDDNPKGPFRKLTNGENTASPVESEPGCPKDNSVDCVLAFSKSHSPVANTLILLTLELR